jgi:hypothetical protein
MNVVLTNVLLALLVVILFGVTSSVFNSTIDDNRPYISARYRALVAWFGPITGPLLRAERGLQTVTGRARLSTLTRVLVVLGLTGVIYGFLSPDFGLTTQGAFLFVSLVIGLGVLTYLSEGGSTILATRAFHVESSVRLFGAAVVVAIAFVAISRLTDFRPGFVYGFVASSLILGGATLDPRRSAQLIVIPSLALLVAGLGAWLVLVPLHDAALQDGTAISVIADTVAATIFVGAFEGLFFNMIPLTFMDGKAVYQWNKIAWALLFGISTFLFWQLVINQYASYLDAFRQTNVQICLAILAIYGGLTLATWAFFRYRRRNEGAETVEA